MGADRVDVGYGEFWEKSPEAVNDQGTTGRSQPAIHEGFPCADWRQLMLYGAEFRPSRFSSGFVGKMTMPDGKSTIHTKFTGD